tara:strand:+ start:189 stop:740 length:552 start_codon:yes stop_codon:yes gene_type:complete
MSDQINSNEFWKYAVDIYNNRDIKSQLLTLQNTLDVDVNIVIFCFWFAYKNVPLHSFADLCAPLIKISDGWQSIIKPIRLCREKLKAQIGKNLVDKVYQDKARSVRAQILQNELDLEAFQILDMYHLATPIMALKRDILQLSERKVNAGKYCLIYCAQRNLILDKVSKNTLNHIIDKVFIDFQ